MNGPNAVITPGPLPKYRQLLIILRNQILSGQIGPGERLPSEEELVSTYGLSRGTVRKAISQLEAERLIETGHGLGSFVRAFHPNAIPFHFLPSPWESADQEEQASYEVLSQEIVPASEQIAEKLRLPPGAFVIHIARRKLVGEQTVSYSERYLHEEILPSLVTADLTRIGSIHELLVGSSDYPLLRAELEIEAHMLNAEQARLLKARPGQPAIVVQRMTYTAPNRPAVWYYGLFKRQYYTGVGLPL
jgi:GntR family transcriptional regulator